MKFYITSFLCIGIFAHHTKGEITWTEAYQKADGLVKQMSLEQKVGIMTGNGMFGGPCTGNTGIVDGLFPSLCVQDGPVGVRGSPGVSVGVAEINAAASFDREAIRQRGEYLGDEFRGKGANVYLGPSVNIVRSPYAGRNYETFGEDPYLSGEAGVATINGVQSKGVIAQVKHLIANEQETWRMTSSSNVGDRALNEVYLWPFQEAINTGVGSIMCSYNKVNGTYACENEYILNTIVKKRLSFKGFITSDWLATHSTANSANHGLDMEMPGPSNYGRRLVLAVKNGEVTEEKINEMALRIVATWYKLEQDKNYPTVNMNTINHLKDQRVDVQGNHKQYIRTLGAASIVLLKNQNHALPLQTSKTKRIAVIGRDAGSEGELWNNACLLGFCLGGSVAMGGGSGSSSYPYIITPLQGIKDRAGKNIKIDHVPNFAVETLFAHQTTKEADVAIVFASVFTMEAIDRTNMNLNGFGNELIKEVASINPNTIVVIHSPSAVLMPWIDHPNIKAVVWAGYPGQETGNSLADVLFGDVNPSGRLPYTIAKKGEDYPAHISLLKQQVDYTEGIFVGYRHFDQNKIDPLFEFGFGLSYTNFTYNNLIATVASNQPDKQVTAIVTVKNTGGMDGAEIVQAYIGFPKSAGEPPKVLRGFEKVLLKKSSSTTVTFSFAERSLSVWDAVKNDWTLTHGTYTLYVGASSRDIRQSTIFTL